MVFNMLGTLLFIVIVLFVGLSIFTIVKIIKYEGKIAELNKKIEENSLETPTIAIPQAKNSVDITAIDRDDLLRRMLYAAAKPDPYVAAKGIVDTLLNYNRFDIDAVSLFLYNDKRKSMRLLYSNIGDRYETAVQGYVNELNEQVRERGKKGYAMYTEGDNSLNYITADTRQIKYMFYIPIYRGENLLGSLMVESRNPECRKTLSLNFFKLVVENISLVLSNIILMKQVIATAQTDALTGAYTRKHIDVFTNPLIKTGTSMCFIMSDIDFFKKVNDTYGHLTGDMVIKAVVKAFKRVIREDEDAIFRYGGEEFLIVFLTSDMIMVRQRAEKVRQMIEKTKMISEDGREFHITISQGISRFDESEGLQNCISNADKALYHSKETGRNKVTMFAEIEDIYTDADEIYQTETHKVG